MRALLAAAVVAAAATAATLGAGGLLDTKPRTQPDSVATSCRLHVNARACSIALRYLAALDLDQADEACALLDRSTLEAAGGMSGCTQTLGAAKGIRIHYTISGAAPSLLGTTIRFSTWANGDAPVRQQMLVSPDDRIVMIVPEIWAAPRQAPVAVRHPVPSETR
jgi:hypothetical protein